MDSAENSIIVFQSDLRGDKKKKESFVIMKEVVKYPYTENVH